MSDNKFVCEICLESVNYYEPHIRIGADQVIQDQHGVFTSLMKNNVMVFAVYHTDCLQAVNPDDAYDVLYIEEAKELLDTLEDSNDAQDNRIVGTRGGYLA